MHGVITFAREQPTCQLTAGCLQADLQQSPRPRRRRPHSGHHPPQCAELTRQTKAPHPRKGGALGGNWYQFSATVTPPDIIESCSSSAFGCASTGTSNTIVVDILLPGLISPIVSELR